MRKIVLLMAVLCFGLYAEEWTLARNGKTDYVIVLPAEAPAVLKSAADELADHLFAVTGAVFPIITEQDATEGRPAFRIGGHTEEYTKQDETAILFQGKDIFLEGQMPRGPLYAVYHFLENYVGIRWWTPEECDIPRRPTLTVNAQDYRYAPSIWMREAHYESTNHNPRFAARLKVNGHFHQIPEELGGHWRIIGFCHTFGQILPERHYFEAHPDWFGMVDGKRQGYQLCLTNEEMKKEFIKKALELVRKNPEAGMISISQNDNAKPCECPACKAIDEEEGSPSGLLLRFCNDVAEAIEAEFPGFLINTLAYWYTRHPPKITRPRHNLVIELCDIESNFAQAQEDGPDNASFKEDLEKWSELAPRLYIWNYLANFVNYLLPQPNYRNIGKDLRYFVKMKTIGCFEQGDTYTNVGDFMRMRAWLVSHLLWNPDQDERALMLEFLNGYYGKAGSYLMEYLDFLCDTVEKRKFKLRCFLNNVYGWMDLEAMNEAIRLYARAEEAVKNEPLYASRVRRERIPLDVVCLRALPALIQKQRLVGGKLPLDIQEPLRLATEFVELTKECKFYREGVGFGTFATDMLDAVIWATTNELPKIPQICEGKDPNSWELFAVNGFELAGKGKWVDVVEEPSSLQGSVARLKGNTNQWAVQQRLFHFPYRDGKWRIVFRARLNADAKTGTAFRYGVYDNSGRNSLLEGRVDVDQFAGKEGEFVQFISEPFSMGALPFIWISPPHRPLAEVNSIDFDAILLIRDGFSL